MIDTINDSINYNIKYTIIYTMNDTINDTIIYTINSAIYMLILIYNNHLYLPSPTPVGPPVEKSCTCRVMCVCRMGTVCRCVPCDPSSPVSTPERPPVSTFIESVW